VNKKIPIIFTLLAVSFMMLGPSLNNAFADIIPPKKQISLGISPDDISCETGMFKIIRDRTDSVSCVKISSVVKLIAKGWAKPVEQKALDVKIKEDVKPLATINILYVEPIKTQYGKITGTAATSGYDFAFEICAGSQKIFVPEVLIKSDSQTQRYEIPDNIAPNSCLLSATFIKASDPNSIKVTLLNKGDISKLLADGEANIATIQSELDNAKKALGDKSAPDTSQTAKIVDLRKQLNDAKEDLYRLYFTIYANPTEKYDIKKLSFTGETIEGESAKILAVKKSVSAENTYDAVFEACTGEKQIALPIVLVSSDTEATNVKIGNKISPNTCQMTSVKITATNPDSITAKMAGNVESNKVADLEDQLVKLQKEIVGERDALRKLFHDPKESNFNEQVEMHTAKIIELRNQISSIKDDYNKILYQTYRQ
jgi:predicted  nucleic acid-binding Zn-ribbon protein